MPDRSRKLLTDEKDAAAVALGRKGGLKGGKARAAKLTPEERSEAARAAAKARWAKPKGRPSMAELRAQRQQYLDRADELRARIEAIDELLADVQGEARQVRER